jgi:hypothetical protein
MAKTFLAKRSSGGIATMMDATDHALKELERVEKRHGQAAKEVTEPVLVLGFLYYLMGDYRSAEPMLLRYVAMAKEHFGQNTRETLEGLGLLFEIYVELSCMGDVARIGNEANAVSRKLRSWPHPPLVEALLLRAERYKQENKPPSRQRGFTFAAMSLCWCITRAFDRNPAGAPVLERLRLFFKSYGIEDEWEWVVKHARLNKYDFVGLLSILLHHTGLAPEPVVTVARARRRSNGVRYHYIGPDAGVCGKSSGNVVKPSGRLDSPGN